ncbi:MAG TPA: AraC family transcriptional regulator [Caulobacteraceae bacterium]
MAELTVAAGLARGLMELAVAKGASRAELATRSRIDPLDLDDQDRRIAFAAYVNLMRAAKELTGDPALALHYGETNDLAQISVVGLLGHASETMMDAMVQLNRYGRLVIEFDGPERRFEVVRKGGEMWLADARENPNEFPELTESTFSRLVCGPRRFGVTQIAKAVHFTHAAPAYLSEYDRIFQAPVTFEAPWNALNIDLSWALHPVALQPRYVFGILSERADALMKELEGSKSVRGTVERLLMPILHKGEARMESIAAAMGVSRQTLFRRLKAEGVTFERVLDELRHKLALDYLAGRKVSVNETAYLVGFSEPAAFSRAFKRWTGQSPRGHARGRA